MNIKNEVDSGMGKGSLVPDELKGWNWGAFFLNWIWGIGNSTYIALLMFIPVVNLILPFVLGAKGNEWAWQNRTWRDVQHFKSTQKKWTIAGLIVFFILLPILFVSIMSMLKGEAFKLSVTEVKKHPEVQMIVGSRPEPGFFITGQVQHSGAQGEANLSYSMQGSTGKVQVYVYATKLNAIWDLKEVVAIDSESDKKIIVKTSHK